VNQQKNQPAMEFFNTIGGKRSFRFVIKSSWILAKAATRRIRKERSLEEGRELSDRDRSRLARILSQHESQNQLQARAERLRPHLE
jgi:hypothetical protein